MSDLVERLRALAEKATPGPWQVNGVRSKMRRAFGNHTFPVHDVGPDGDALAAIFFEEKTGRGFIDAKFIAACDPQTILALIARIAELEGESAALIHDNGNLLASLSGECAARVSAEGERDTATRALAEMRKALLMYGDHESDCEAGTAIRESDFDPRRDKCTCGFRAALSKTEGKG